MSQQDDKPPRKPAGIRLADHRTALVKLERRLFLRSSLRTTLRASLSVGALSMLSGCDLQDNDQVDKVLWAMSRWNDRVQAAIFRGDKLAPTYAASQITNPFPFNAFYDEVSAPDINVADWRLEVSGRVSDKQPWTIERLRTLPQAAQITRHICIEGWSAIGQWSGIPLCTFLQAIGADMTAKYVGFKCADRYYSSLDMPTALHPQTILALDFGNEALPTSYGFPLKVRVPTKLGFKNPKHVVALYVTNQNPGGYWEDQGYNWFSGV